MKVVAAAPCVEGATERVGSYLLYEVIGRGGTGVVFRARHEGTGELVALKKVLAENVRDIGSMRREIDALRRLNHPGVVRIVAQGIHAGVPWYAMELLQGETLASYARRLWESSSPASDIRTAPTDQSLRSEPPQSGAASERPAPSREAPRVACGELSVVLRIVRRLCDTLGFIHGEGIVHRDLKSSNVLLCAGGVPKLLDFGLAWRFPGGSGREVLEDVSASAAGTAGYMAPEQIRGEMVDARADLYSLGCVLYELATGRPPFTGRSAAEVRRCHLEAPVLPPSVLVTGVPQALEELILALLEKSATRRPGHAGEVATALASIAGDSAGWDGQVLPRSYVYRCEIVGRGEALRLLGSHVDRAFRRDGSVVLISGESGVGKTYLAMAAAREAVSRGLRVITSTCVPGGAAGGPNDATLQPFRNLLLAIADRCVATPALTPELLGARAKVLAACEPSLASLPSIADYPELEPLPARAAQERLLGALAETLAAFAAVCPFVCIVDDVQWCDELSLRFLSSLPSAWFADKGIVIVGVYRTDEETEPLRALGERPHVRRLALGRLSDEELGAMVRGMLGLGAAPLGFVDYFVRQAGGNPFFAAEYLRTAVAEQLLYRGPTGDWQTDPQLLDTTGGRLALALPSSIAAVIARRLEGLGALTQRVLAAAAVLGGEIELDLLLDVAELPEEAAWQPTRELIARQILEEIDSERPEAGPARFRFLHDKLRDAAYTRIPASERRTLHRRAADALERKLSGSPELLLVHALLAYHHEQGGRLREAIDHLELAGEHALETYANADAVRHFAHAVELDARARSAAARAVESAWPARDAGAPASRARRADLRAARWQRKLAEAHYALGDLEAVEQHVVRGLQLAGYPPPSTRLGWHVSLVVELARQVLQRAGVSRSDVTRLPLEQEALVEGALGTHHLAERRYYSFEPLPMIAASLRAVNLGERAGVAVPIATPYAMLGMAAGISHMSALGRRYFELARSAAIATNDDAGLAYSLYAEAAWRVGEGAWDEVRTLSTECLAVAGPSRNVKALGMAQTLLGHAAFYTGRFRESVAIYRELEETARATGDRQHLSWALYAGARARICLGELEQSRAMLLESNALLEPLVEVPSKIIAPGLLASVHLRCGDLEAALAVADLTTPRIRKNLPTVFSTVAGYAGVAEVYLARWSRFVQGESHRRAELSAARRAAKRAILDLLTLALNIPLGKPYYQRLLGEAHRIQGKLRAARSAFERGLGAAVELGMPYEEALLHLELARLAPQGTVLRQRHLSRAERLLEQMECRFDLERARELRAVRRQEPPADVSSTRKS